MPARGNRVTCGAAVTGPQCRTRRPKILSRAGRERCVWRVRSELGHARTRAPQVTQHCGLAGPGWESCLRASSEGISTFVDARRETRVRELLWTRQTCALRPREKQERHGKVRQARRSRGNGEVCGRRGNMAIFDYSPYASRAPGPSLVRVVDIRGPRSRQSRDDQQTNHWPKTPPTRQEHY